MKVTIKIGRVMSFRASDGRNTEAIVVAVPIGAEATIASVMEATALVEASAKEVLAKVPDSRLHHVPRLRGGWSPAVVQEIVAPVGEGTKHGYPYQKGKI